MWYKSFEGYLFGTFNHFEDIKCVKIAIDKDLFMNFTSVETKNCIWQADLQSVKGVLRNSCSANMLKQLETFTGFILD